MRMRTYHFVKVAIAAISMQLLTVSLWGQDRVGIGTTSPTGPLSFANSFGNKIVFWGNGANGHYGMGVQSTVLQLYTDEAFSNIAFGYGRSEAFTERAKIVNTGLEGMYLNGRLNLRNGDPANAGGGGGIWLYKPDNSAMLAFMGTQNDKNIGFYGGPTGWGFTYEATTGRVGIGNNNPNAPLAFAPTLGKKITLYPGATGDVGFAVQGNLLLLYSDHPNADVAIGYDQAGLFVERMRVRGNGNVGVGTSIPSEKLEVNGTIKANGYKFPSPKTYYYSISATAFGAGSGTQPAVSLSTGAFCSANPTPSGRISAPVYLPQGALITEFKVYYYDNSTVSDVRSLLFGNPLGTDGLFTMATVTSSGAAGLGNGAQAGVGWQINNQANAYSIECFSTNNEWPGAGLQIKSVVITYTLPEVN